MVVALGLLGEFINMINQLTAKNYEKISHIELPTELLHLEGNRQNNSIKEGYNTGTLAKKVNKDQERQGRGEPKKLRVMHPWSNKLKEVLQRPMTDAD